MNTPFNILSKAVRNKETRTDKQQSKFAKLLTNLSDKTMLNGKSSTPEANLLRIFNKQHRIFNFQRSSVTNNDRAVTNNDRAVTNSDRAVTNNDRAVTNSDRAATNNDRAVTKNDRAVTKNDRRVTNNGRAVTKNDRRVTNSDRADSNKHRAKQNLLNLLKKHSKKRTVIKKDDKNVKEFINAADEYLHYSNDVMFFICNSHTAVNFIILSLNAEGSVTALVFVILKRSLKAKYFIQRIEQTKIFDGVIERYCGVPP